MKESVEEGELGMNAQGGALAFTKMSMARFAEFLSGPLQMPVVDRTGLTGRYDFTVDVGAFAGPSGAKPEELDALFPALQRQLGLKMERRKVNLDVVVVDRAVKVPVENEK